MAFGAEKVTNGSFTIDKDPPDDWTSSINATLTTESGGQSGNCMKVLNAGGTSQYGYQPLITIIGRAYMASVYAKKGTTTARVMVCGSGILDEDFLRVDEATGVWTLQTVKFIANSTTSHITCRAQGADGLYAYFDEVSLKQIYPSARDGMFMGMGIEM